MIFSVGGHDCQQSHQPATLLPPRRGLGMHENLRRQIYAERTLQPQAIEAMATALGVPPEYFKEYRQYRCSR